MIGPLEEMRTEAENLSRKQSGKRYLVFGLTKGLRGTKTPLGIGNILRHTQNAVGSRH